MVGKTSIRPTSHYLRYHNNIEWDLVITTILSPTKIHPSKQHGKNRFTYLRRFQKCTIEVHTEKDQVEEIIWVINAFKN